MASFKQVSMLAFEVGRSVVHSARSQGFPTSDALMQIRTNSNHVLCANSAAQMKAVCTKSIRVRRQGTLFTSLACMWSEGISFMLHPEKSLKAISKTRLCLVAGKEEESLL